MWIGAGQNVTGSLKYGLSMLKGGFASVKEKDLQLEEQVKKWINGNELGKDALFKKSTFMKWWETLPYEHKLKSCIKDIEGFMSV